MLGRNNVNVLMISETAVNGNVKNVEKTLEKFSNARD